MQQGQSSKYLNFLCLSVAPRGKLQQHVKNSLSFTIGEEAKNVFVHFLATLFYGASYIYHL